MNSGIRIMVLCNNEIALPAMQQLFMAGSLAVVVIPEKNKSLYSCLAPLFAGTGISIYRVSKKNMEATIRSQAAEKKITSAWLMTFSYIIPKSLLRLLPGGFINFHYGLLPQYRGPNPILAQMLRGESYGGITVHLVDEHIDTGPIVMQQKIPIDDTDTFGIQLQKLGILGASMAINLLRIYGLQPIPLSVPQDESIAAYHKKPTATDLMVDWERMSSREIIRLINACNPWNKGAGAVINSMVVCFTAAEFTNDIMEENLAPGTITCLDETGGLKICCSDGKVIRVTIIYTPEGFFTGDKIAGYRIKVNDRFAPKNIF